MQSCFNPHYALIRWLLLNSQESSSKKETLKRKEPRGGNDVVVCICKPVNNMFASSSVIYRVSNKSSKFGRTICSLYVRTQLLCVIKYNYKTWKHRLHSTAKQLKGRIIDAGDKQTQRPRVQANDLPDDVTNTQWERSTTRHATRRPQPI